MRHALDLVEHFRGSGHIVRFIEYMDVGTCNDWRRDLVVPSAELRERIDARWPLVALEANYGGEVAQRYAFADGGGEIGFISSVSEPFCGDCSRARLSADGRLYTCLFARSGHDLRGPMRAGASDAELAGLISAVWNARDDRYSELRSSTRAWRARARRDVRDRRLSGWRANFRMWIPPDGRAWSTSAPRSRRGARPPPKRACVFPPMSHRRCARKACGRRKDRSSTRRSSPARWRSSARTN